MQIKTGRELSRMKRQDVIAYAQTLGIARHKCSSGFVFDNFARWTKAEIIEMIFQKKRESR